MPFGLDLKSLVVGALLVMFVWPWLAGMLASRKSAPAAA